MDWGCNPISDVAGQGESSRDRQTIKLVGVILDGNQPPPRDESGNHVGHQEHSQVSRDSHTIKLFGVKMEVNQQLSKDEGGRQTGHQEHSEVPESLSPATPSTRSLGFGIPALGKESGSNSPDLGDVADRWRKDFEGEYFKRKPSKHELARKSYVNHRPLFPTQTKVHVKLSLPDKYGGDRDLKKMNTWVYNLENYLGAAGLEEKFYLSHMQPFLKDDAAIWWQLQQEEMRRGIDVKIKDWVSFKEALKARFLPSDIDIWAREQLEDVKHVTTIKEYVTKFSAAVILCSDMNEIDKLHRFFAGLKPWAREKVKDKRPTNLCEAMSIADRLVDQYESKVGAKDEKTNKKRKYKFSWKKRGKNKTDHPGWNCGGTDHFAKGCKKAS